MKKLLFFFFAAAAVAGFYSCESKAGAASNGGDANAALLAKNDHVYKCIETGDTTGLADWIAADIVDHGDGNKDYSGRDNAIKMLSGIHNSFQPGFKMTVLNEQTDGNYMYIYTEMTGTTTATPEMGMPPSTKMDSKAIDLVRIKDGHAVEHWGFQEPAEMMKMMAAQHQGPPPPPPAPADSAKK